MMKQGLRDVYAISDKLWVIAFQPQTASYGLIRKGGEVGAYTWEVWHNNSFYQSGEAGGFDSAIYSSRASWLGVSSNGHKDM